MPHIVIEIDKKTKKEIDLAKLTSSLHQTMAAQDTVKIEALKTRTIEVEDVIIGDGSQTQMIHVNILLLTGRTEELKGVMADAVFAEVQKQAEGINCSLTVNVDELGVYRK